MSVVGVEKVHSPKLFLTFPSRRQSWCFPKHQSWLMQCSGVNPSALLPPRLQLAQNAAARLLSHIFSGIIYPRFSLLSAAGPSPVQVFKNLHLEYAPMLWPGSLKIQLHNSFIKNRFQLWVGIGLFCEIHIIPTLSLSLQKRIYIWKQFSRDSLLGLVEEQTCFKSTKVIIAFVL